MISYSTYNAPLVLLLGTSETPPSPAFPSSYSIPMQQPSAGRHRLSDIPRWLLFSILVFLHAFLKKSPVSFAPLKS
jgi:hypothetical protein